MPHLIADRSIPNIKPKIIFRVSGCPQYAKSGHFTLLFCNETGTVEYSTELAFNSNLPNLFVLNVAFYMHLIRQFDLAHVKCDVLNQALQLWNK